MTIMDKNQKYMVIEKLGPLQNNVSSDQYIKKLKFLIEGWGNWIMDMEEVSQTASTWSKVVLPCPIKMS